MTEREAMGAGDGWWRTRTGRAALVGAVLVAAAVVVLVLALGGRSGAPQATPAPTAPAIDEGGAGSQDGSAEPSDESPGPEGEQLGSDDPTDEGATAAGADEGEAAEPVVPQDQLDPALPPVALDDPAPFGDGVTASLVDIEAARLAADGPGEVAGPGLRLTVRMDNRTDEAIAAGLAVVNLYAGPDLLPCEPMVDGARELSGELGPGEAAEGVYVFAVPADLRDHVRVTVAYDPTVPMVVMEGPAPAA